MISPNSEAYRLLYCDDDGIVIGLDEVQYLEPPQSERIIPLRALLTGEDATARFHSMLVLVAWADPAGIAAAEEYLTFGRNSNDYVSSHRLHGRDLSYNELADALAMAVKLNGARGVEIIQLARHFLSLFRTEFFEGGLVRLLSALAMPELAAETLEAIRSVRSQGHIRQASDLLPALAAVEPQLAVEAFNLFVDNGEFLPEAEPGVAHALGWIDTPEALRELERLSQSTNPGTDVAVESALHKRRRRDRP